MVMPGYKQTEVGEIPEDWDVKPLSDLVENSRLPSGLYKNKSLYGKGTKIIKLGDVFRLDVFQPDLAQRAFLTESEKHSYKVNIGDIFIALASVKLEGVGKVMIVHKLDETTAFDHNVALIRTNDGVESPFLLYLMKSSVVRTAVGKNATQVGTTFLKGSTILGFQLPIPSNNEQKVIAKALSDVDELIVSLEKLLAKKQDIKTATMQQFLSGKKRLIGFDKGKGYKQTDLGLIPEDWELKHLDSISNVIDPHPSHRAPAENTNGIPFLGIGDFDESGNLIKNDFRVVSSEIYDQHVKRYNLNDGLLGLGRVASIGKVIRLRSDIGKYTISPTLGIIQPLKIDYEFLRVILNSEIVGTQFKKIMSGSTRSSVGMHVLRELLIPLPTDPKESEELGNIFSSMDDEMNTLQNKLNKTKAIKQGMMKELLTGRTRLI